MNRAAKSTPSPAQLGAARRGRPRSLDFFDNSDDGRNVAVVGATGSGKSTLTTALFAAAVAAGRALQPPTDGATPLWLDALDAVQRRSGKGPANSGPRCWADSTSQRSSADKEPT
jgi:predicted NACHT family NTPase